MQFRVVLASSVTLNKSYRVATAWEEKFKDFQLTFLDLFRIGLSSVLRPRQHSIGYMEDGFLHTCSVFTHYVWVHVFYDGRLYRVFNVSGKIVNSHVTNHSCTAGDACKTIVRCPVHRVWNIYMYSQKHSMMAIMDWLIEHGLTSLATVFTGQKTQPTVSKYYGYYGQFSSSNNLLSITWFSSFSCFLSCCSFMWKVNRTKLQGLQE